MSITWINKWHNNKDFDDKDLTIHGKIRNARRISSHTSRNGSTQAIL